MATLPALRSSAAGIVLIGLGCGLVVPVPQVVGRAQALPATARAETTSPTARASASLPSTSVMVPQITPSAAVATPVALPPRQNSPTASPHTRVAADAVEIPSLGQRWGIEASHVADHKVTIPEAPTRVGVLWPSGERGTGVAIVVGHVRWKGRDGAFSTLSRVRVGMQVMTRLGGQVRRWRVTSVATHPRGQLPAELFAPGADDEVALVTCAGPIVDGNYTRNLVVRAVPA